MSEQVEGGVPTSDPAQSPAAEPAIHNEHPEHGSTAPTPEVAAQEGHDESATIQPGHGGDEGELVMPFVDPVMLATMIEFGFMEV